MSALSSALAQFRTLDELAAQDPPLARRDPRAKLVTTLLFLFALLSCGRQQWLNLLLLALYPALLVRGSGLPLPLLLRTAALASPLVLMTAGLEPWLDGTPAATVAGVPLSGGLLTLGTTLLRFVLGVSAVLALLAATGMPALGGALARLGVPAALTTQLLLLHRYATVLLEEGARISTAWRLRAGTGARLPLGVYGSLAGQWLLRTVQRASRIHAAMLARGFDGRWPETPGAAWRGGDTVFTAAWCAWFLLCRFGI